MPLFLPDQGTHKKVSLFSAIHLPDFFKYLLPVVFQNLDERIVAVFVLMLQLFIAPFFMLLLFLTKLLFGCCWCFFVGLFLCFGFLLIAFVFVLCVSLGSWQFWDLLSFQGKHFWVCSLINQTSSLSNKETNKEFSLLH